MDWVRILPTIIAVMIYSGILWFIGWLFGITEFVQIIKAGRGEFKQWAGKFSFAAFVLVLLFLLHHRAVEFIESFLRIIAGNDSQNYEIGESMLLTISIPLSYFLLNFFILAIFNKPD